MPEAGEESRAPDQLPEVLVEELDALEPPALRAVSQYAEQRLSNCRSSLAERVRAEVNGDIVDVEDDGVSALVWRRRPGTERTGSDAPLVSLFRVTLEPRPDGEETLHWSFLGDVRDLPKTECSDCGKPVEDPLESCPHCGREVRDRGGEDGV